MRRFLRLVLLCLIALALPAQGVLAATGMRLHAAAHEQMTMPDGSTMDAADMPCHDHGLDKSGGCGACCGPIVVQQAMLQVAPTATRWAPLKRAALGTKPAAFLTGGTDRPPRPSLA